MLTWPDLGWWILSLTHTLTSTHLLTSHTFWQASVTAWSTTCANGAIWLVHDVFGRKVGLVDVWVNDSILSYCTQVLSYVQPSTQFEDLEMPSIWVLIKWQVFPVQFSRPHHYTIPIEIWLERAQSKFSIWRRTVLDAGTSRPFGWWRLHVTQKTDFACCHCSRNYANGCTWISSNLSTSTILSHNGTGCPPGSIYYILGCTFWSVLPHHNADW